MDLLKLYEELSSRISAIDFEFLWRGFKRTKFALYTDTEVCYDGQLIAKTPEFIGNTAIFYNGENIAIWKIADEYDVDIIASKIIHEMFHAFQKQFPNFKYPNEIEATRKYSYSADNLSAKMQENIILSEISVDFDMEKWMEFCSLRKYRLEKFPYETNYEIAVEQVEGSANYVELCALKQLSESKYNHKLSGIRQGVTDIQRLFPTRIISYDIGALLIKAVKQNFADRQITLSSENFLADVLDNAAAHIAVDVNKDIALLVDSYYSKTKLMVKNAIDKNGKVEVSGVLTGYNIYNARYVDGFVLSSFFMMYKNGEKENALYGDFVIEIDETMNIKNVYRADLEL